MSLTKLKRQIVELEAKGSIDKVVELLKGAIEEYPNEGTLFNKLGDLYIKKNRMKDAVDVYLKGVEAFKNESYYSNAIALCKKIIRHDNQRLEVYHFLGELHAELGQKGEAANYYLQYADKNFDNGDVESALDAYLHIKELLPNNPRVAERIGDIYSQLEKDSEAENLYKEAISIYESIGEKDKARELSAKLGIKKEMPEEKEGVSIDSLVSPEVAALLEGIEEEVEEKIEEEPPVKEEKKPKVEEKIEAKVEKPEIKPKVKKKAEKKVTEKKEPSDTIAKTIELGELYLSLDRTDEALECFLNAGEQSYKNKGYEKAREIYLKVSNLKPDDLKVRQRLIEIAKRTGDKQLAAKSMVEMAQLLLQKEAKSQAKRMLSKALEIDPKNKTAKKILGGIKEKEKEFIDLGDILRAELGTEEKSRLSIGELIQEFRKEVFESIGESDFKSHYDLGVAYKEMGLFAEAIEEFGIALKDPELNLKSKEMIASCYYERKKYKEAITILKKALKTPGYRDSDYVGIHLLLGRCYEALKRDEDALREYEIVYHQDPSLAEVKEKLARFKRPAKKEKAAPRSGRKGRISYL